MLFEPPRASAVRVLVADDDRVFAESLSAALTEGDQVDVVGIAENGREAIALAAELRPDVILMDLKTPVIDGLEATRRIRETGLETKILLLSGTDEETGSRAAAAAGANAFLRKEGDLEELRHVVFEVASLAAALASQKRP
jgi:DNA-binding NarL/FixJ family response regulator